MLTLFDGIFLKSDNTSVDKQLTIEIVVLQSE